jgi:hypothetical protein
MRKTLFEGVESHLLVYKLQDDVVIEMIGKGCNIDNLQIEDSYNKIILNEKDFVFLGGLLLQLTADEE